MGEKVGTARNWVADKFSKSWIKREWSRPGGRFWLILGAVVVVLVVWMLFGLLFGKKDVQQSGNGATVSAKEEAAQSTCRKAQPWKDGPYYQVIPDFDKKVDILVREWQNGKEVSPEAKAQFEKVVLEESGKYPIVLARSAKLVRLIDEKADTNAFAEKLYNKSTGCYTELGEKTLDDLKIAIRIASVVGYEIPADATNSGIVNGKAVNSDSPGILEEHRKGVQLVLPSGTALGAASTFCLNEVNVKENLPKSKDIPKTPPELEQKKPSQDPFARGNAPIGGGYNQDSGPGVYIPPQQMEQPKSTPRVNPTPPSPAPPIVTNPTKPIVPDPTPPPKAEPEAPKADNPAGPGAGSCAPGLSC